MSTQIQRRRGTTAEHSTFTGVEGELTVDTTKDTVVVHDGATTGGRPLLREDQANLPSSVTNGLYTPGTNQLALSTNGTERLRITATGTLLLNTAGSTPGNINALLAYGDTDAGIVYLQRQTGTDQVRFYVGGNRLGYLNTANSAVTLGTANYPLIFNTNDAERLRITSAGLVGIGSSSPQTLLNLRAASGNAILRLENSNTAVGAGEALGAVEWYSNDSSAPSSVAAKINVVDENGFGSAYGMGFYTGAASGGSYVLAERVRIDETGRVGIGTSSPGAKLEIGSTTAATGTGDLTAFEINRSDSTAPLISMGPHEAAQTTASPGASICSNNRGMIIANVATDLSSGEGLFLDRVNSALRLYAGNSERARINSSGNVGIGTSSPSEKLHIQDGTAATIRIDNTGGTARQGRITVTNTGDMEFRARSNTADGQFIFYGYGGVTDSERARITSSGQLLVGTSSSATGVVLSQYAKLQVSGNSIDNAGLIAIRSRLNTASITSGVPLGYVVFADNQAGEYAWIGAECDGTPGTNDYPGRLVFSTTADGASSPTERMRIANNGNFNLYTNFDAGFRTALTSGSSIALFVANGASSTLTGTIQMIVRADGDIENTNNSYGAISDIKLKENIVDAGSQWTDIKALRPVNYNFKSETGYGTHTQLGLIAQEVELVSPGLVSESPDRDAEGNDLGTVTKSVNYSVLYMKAVKALQEAMERIETLEAKVAALESA